MSIGRSLGGGGFCSGDRLRGALGRAGAAALVVEDFDLHGCRAGRARLVDDLGLDADPGLLGRHLRGRDKKAALVDVDRVDHD